MRTGRVMVLAATLAGATASPAFPCTVSVIATPESLVERATLIVHARAERVAVAPGATNRVMDAGGLKIAIPSEGQIEFRVLRVLKGPLTAGDTVTLKGQFEPGDDLNDVAVPYRVVRRGGRRGSCFAANYREGGDYLLLLNRSTAANDLPWTAHWAAIGATNEQLRGPDDPWLTWVAQQVR